MESLTKFPSKKIGRDQRIKKVVKMNPSKSISEKSSTKPICSVIIPVFNGLHYTKDCINSVLNEKSRTPFEIIVVDAGSSDGVEKFLAECGEQIKLLSLPENLGFGHAVNFGSVAAEGDYIITLHSDTMPVPGWLDNMLSLAETDPNISIVGSKQLYPLHSLIQHSGIVFNSNHKPIFIYQGFPDDHSAVNKQREFPAVTDVCMLIRSEVFDDLSGFDDRFKNGFEDFDLCLRARFAGTKVVYQPQSVVYHYAESDERYYSLNTPNSKLFASIWNDRIKSDASEKFSEDGYEAVVNGEGWNLKPAGVNLRNLMDSARESLKEGRLNEAVIKYENLYYLIPHSSTVMRYLARIYEARGNYEKSSTILLRLSSLEPDVEVLLNLAANALKQKNYDLSRRFAEGVLEAITEKNQKVADAYAIIGDSWFKADDLNLAEQQYKLALSITPQHIRSLTGLGTISLTRKQYTGALSMFEQAIAGSPHHGRAILGKGLAYLGLNRLEAATELITEGVKLDPDNGWALTTLLPLLSKLGKFDQAQILLDNYLELYPDDIPILIARAGVSYAQSHYLECNTQLKKIFDIDPENVSALELRAELERIARERQKAAQKTMSV